MKALVYRGKNTIKLEDKDKPTIREPTDAILKIVHTTICGSDLHILQGHVPSCKEGTTIGHEGIGVIEECGDAVRTFKVGDKVLISCITSCASCVQCKKGMYSHCGKRSPSQPASAWWSKHYAKKPTSREGWWVDSGPYCRWHAGRVRQNPTCRRQLASGAGRRGRESSSHAQRHWSHRL